MIFRKTKPDPLQGLVDTLGEANPKPEDEIILALQKYQADFASTIIRPQSSEIEAAQAVVRKARKVIAETGIGRALAPILIFEVQHWHTWSEREDFAELRHFPATDVYGEHETGDGFRSITRIYFRYNGNQYGVILNDKGSHNFGDDYSHHGTIDLIADDTIVLGLDVSEATKYDISRWTWSDVYAFQPGNWMKELLEIEAHIEAGQERFMEEIESDDILSRAKNIKM
ncbi:MAG: hypothetical protein KF750_15610 [Xanthobacteraceae bacterium]|nr:hypothetical protein [Xanthobacteraceae bacterium]